jgi:CBS domain-containing protein
MERCPVVADSVLVGILTRGDILRKLLTEMTRENEDSGE